MVNFTFLEEVNTREEPRNINYKEDVCKGRSTDRLRTSTNFYETKFMFQCNFPSNDLLHCQMMLLINDSPFINYYNVWFSC